MIEYRKLTHKDYEDIVNMCKDIWGGTDYLPELFHTWVDDSGLFLGAVDSASGKVVGADKYSLLHDGTGWLEGLRVHKDYRGMGIAKELTLRTFKEAKSDLESGKICKIAFSTHLTNVESISIMSKLGFELEQQYILVEKDYERLDKNMDISDFKVETWNLSYEEFSNLNYLKRRNNILPFAFYFQKPTRELFNEFKQDNCFIIINGHKGMYKFKGEPHFICFDETPDAIITFMNYYLLLLKGKSIIPPLTSICREDTELIEALKKAGFTSWSNWECDYLYYTYRNRQA